MADSMMGDTSSSSPADDNPSKIEERRADGEPVAPDVESSTDSTCEVASATVPTHSQNEEEGYDSLGPIFRAATALSATIPSSPETAATAIVPIYSEQESNPTTPSRSQTELEEAVVLSSLKEMPKKKLPVPQPAPVQVSVPVVAPETSLGETLGISEEGPVQPVTSAVPRATPESLASTVERKDSNVSDSGAGRSFAASEASPTLNNVHPGGNEDDLDEFIRSPQGQNAIVERSPGGRYVRFMEKLGSGASKDVYRAYDTQEGIEVAWNVVSLAGVPKTERNRIVNEVRLLERLHHHNIISFHGSWVNRERQEVHFVTEILSSGTLKSFINKVQVIRWKIAKRWAVQILKGLEYLHSQDPPVIHRDLKCDNIFINGTSGDLRIGDLGLSTVHRNGRVLSVLGTPEFMAPDMYEEDRSYDEKVDIYAFGMCMLEIFTKEIPYKECKNPAQIYKKVSSGELPEILSRLQSKHARDFIMLCLGYRDENGVFMRPAATELLTHDFLVKRLDDDDEVMVDPPLIKRTITEEQAVSPGSSSVRQPPDQIQLQQSDSGSKTGVQPINAASQAQVSYQKQGSVDEDESDRFDEMPDSEVNFRKVKVLMGRGQELKEEGAPPTEVDATSSIVDRPPNLTMHQVTSTCDYPSLNSAVKKASNTGVAAANTQQGHYLVAAAVIENEADRAYPDDILKLVVTLPVEGQTQNVQFDFHLVEDDPVQVGKEMVAELGIPPGAVLEISETISGLACAARMQRDKFKMLSQQNLQRQLPPTSQRFSHQGPMHVPQPVGGPDLQQGMQLQIGQMPEFGNSLQVQQQQQQQHGESGQQVGAVVEQTPLLLPSQQSHLIVGQGSQMLLETQSQPPLYNHVPNLMQVPLQLQGQQAQHLNQQGGHVNPMAGEAHCQPGSYSFDYGQGQMQLTGLNQGQPVNLGNTGGHHMAEIQSNPPDGQPIHAQPMNYAFDGVQGQSQMQHQAQHLMQPQHIVQQPQQFLPDSHCHSSGSYNYDPRQAHINSIPSHQIMQGISDPQSQPSMYNPGQPLNQPHQQPLPGVHQRQASGETNQQPSLNLPDSQSHNSGSYSYDPRQAPMHMNPLASQQVMQLTSEPQSQSQFPMYNTGQPQSQPQQQPLPCLHKGEHSAENNQQTTQNLPDIQIQASGAYTNGGSDHHQTTLHLNPPPSHQAMQMSSDLQSQPPMNIPGQTLSQPQQQPQPGMHHRQVSAEYAQLQISNPQMPNQNQLLQAGQAMQNILDVSQSFGHGHLFPQQQIALQAPYAVGNAQQQQQQPLPFPQSPNPQLQLPQTHPTSTGAVFEKGVSAPNADAHCMADSSAGLKRSLTSPCHQQRNGPPAMPSLQHDAPSDQQCFPPSRTSSGNAASLVRGISVGSEQNAGEEGAVAAIAEVGEDSDVNDELRQLDEDFHKNLLRAKKVFVSRMDNLQRSQIEREAQHKKTLEKHQKERAEFEKRLQQEEKEQNRRLEQLQREWDRKREVLAKNKRLAAEEGRELLDDASLSTSPDFGFAVPPPSDSAPTSLEGEKYIVNQSMSNESSGSNER